MTGVFRERKDERGESSGKAATFSSLIKNLILVIPNAVRNLAVRNLVVRN